MRPILHAESRVSLYENKRTPHSQRSEKSVGAFVVFRSKRVVKVRLARRYTGLFAETLNAALLHAPVCFVFVLAARTPEIYDLVHVDCVNLPYGAFQKRIIARSRRNFHTRCYSIESVYETGAFDKASVMID